MTDSYTPPSRVCVALCRTEECVPPHRSARQKAKTSSMQPPHSCLIRSEAKAHADARLGARAKPARLLSGLFWPHRLKGPDTDDNGCLCF